jgi:hypothetical protein
MKEKTMFVLAVGVMAAILVAIIGDYICVGRRDYKNRRTSRCIG